MYKENLFQLIRKEEVIIWAGAGLSLYAGYPSGCQLSEILTNRLTPKERQCVNPNLPLPELAEEFYRVKGNNRNALVRILNEIFLDQSPIEDELHTTLSKIPHFKTIITTNYDTLLEDAFAKERCQVIISSNRIPYLDKNKTQIFKVHGDLTEPDSIIITKSDYINFFKNGDENEVFWTVIKERLSTNSVLFLGYNIEDYNVSAIFERITEVLGNNRKECFLVAPNLPPHKINSLLAKGILYIDSTAEDLLSDLVINLKENIITDVEKGATSADTFRLFLKNLDLTPELIANHTSFKVKSINGIRNKVDGNLSLTIKSDLEFMNEFKEFAEGKKFGILRITPDKLIKADLWLGGLKFPNDDKFHELRLESKPRIETSFDIIFDDGFELNDIPIKIFSSQAKIEFQLEFQNELVIIELNLNNQLSDDQQKAKINFNFNYKHKELCNNIKSEIEFYAFLKYLAQGRHFSIHEKSGRTLSSSFSKIEALIDIADHYLEYFKNLKAIEQYYKIHFSSIPFGEITDSMVEDVEVIMSVIENRPIECEWDDTLNITLEENFSYEVINQLVEVDVKKTPLATFNQEEEIINIHGHEINVGYKKVEFRDIFITNIESIIRRESNVVKVKCRDKKIIISYLKEKMGD